MAIGKFICHKCDKKLEPENIVLEYLGRRMTHQFLSCPECKLIYIPEEIVEGKIHQVEIALEDK
ncbi:hypothetical protein SPSIL_036970 [Sporomusa silvacetica DSM 10669]|uniref:DUF7479 domain-containing protein n=1 Tax=Sporomusa silvacetica DSM 10669 TaxID=1123289 RepID=A0ABZ3IQ40_9FIRM|nr:CLJU_RS11820 family redox protein [Sporomusa silvacetica]OZC19880.1 hypothetical protein SPSIL_18030 [Sporomusa silvacetica DSM 10669]